MNSTLKVLFAASALTITASAFAAQPASFGPGTQGFYVGADAGAGYTSCDKCSFTDNGSTSSSQYAGNIFGGYQLNQYVAFEAGWGSLPGVEYKISQSSLSTSSNDVNTAAATHFYGAIKGMIALPKQFGLFGKVGYDYMSVASTTLKVIDATTEVDSYNASGVLLAAGGSYAINPNLALTLAYNQLIDSHTKDGSTLNLNVSYGTLGLTYLF